MSQSKSFDITGKLHKVFDAERKSETFSTREFILELDGQYPQLIKFQAVQDRCGLLDDFRPGEIVTVSFDLRGREWNGKYLTNLNAWRIQLAPAEVALDTLYGNHEPEPVAQVTAPSGDTAAEIFGTDDDLPF